ncbi:hypothetical protein [Halioxenophilus aromaticivorans]|uniref:Uncharacterized protein n=1 Tax=Halioxenophilus aromaticivorans TaxID=1306992 RepID=A0AAV3U5J3_9ALTE
MDPVTYLFSAYLNTVQSNVHRQLTDSIGTEIKAVTIEYQGMTIPFQYQMWRIKDDSVCGSYSQDIQTYSQCTVKARDLFSDLCTHLSENPKNHWRHIKSKNMYCNASITYKPTIASISAGTEQSDLAKARKACNSATVAAMGASDPSLIEERKVACAKYEALKK